ncbi:TonB-dependent receptor [Rhizomicrobium electricum]|nr:TonB-dependent receptor [Rhizomicrobium electricum]NIJ50635.1 iron complex outermembrane receptor protein [Rhizomicrobium electricum]
MIRGATIAALMLTSAHAASEEVLVTASKRGPDANLPVALDVADAAGLASRNVANLTDLSGTMASVAIDDLGTARGIANITIRGIGVNSSIASVDPAVGVFRDGLYVGMNAGTLTALFDVAAVEVLRGPQGTLYGHNVTGGAVLIRTRQPGDAFEAYGTVTVESGPDTTLKAAVSGPIVPSILSGRIAVMAERDDGWFTNRYDGSKFGADSRYGVRASLRFTPTPSFEAILRAEHGQDNGDGPAGQNHAVFARGSFDFSIDNRGRAATDWTEASLDATWRIGGGTLTGLAGWRSVTVPWAADIDSTPHFVFHTRILNIEQQHNGELRYAGEFGPASFVVGASYFDESLTYIDERNFSPTFRRTGGGQGYFQSWAGFTDTNWRLGDTLELDAGLRFTYEHKHSRISRVRRAADDLDGAVVVPGEGVEGGSIDAKTLAFSDSPFLQSWTDLSPRLGVQWTPDPDTDVYATWSRGFRSGGANFRTSSLGLKPRTYEPETVSTFELGLKRHFTGGQLSAALFHNHVGNMQRETNLADPIAGVQQLVLNAGTADLYGGEAEARVDLTERLAVSANAAYVNGSYAKVVEDLNGDLAVSDADRRMRIPRLAPVSAGIDVTYTMPLLGGELASRAGYRHRDGSYYNDSNLGRLAATDLFDFRIAYTPASGGFGAALYGRNLTNVATWGGDTTLPATAAFGYSGGARPTFSPLAKGRSFGLELSWRN